MERLTLRNPENPHNGSVCRCYDGPDAVVHVEADHDKAKGLRIVSRRCSVCDLPWGEGGISQHERCALLDDDGDRQYAHCIVELSDGTELIYID